jgi:hypothetical protein
MKPKLRDLIVAASTASVIAALFLLPAAVATQAPRPARINGKPNLNGIWQALNTANYDLLSHQAKAALAFRPGPVVPVPATAVVALGAVGAVPGGVGVVDGDEIPYLPEAKKKQIENQANWLDRDPEIKCYLPGVPRANYLPHPFQILHSDRRSSSPTSLPARCATSTSRIRARRRWTRGWGSRWRRGTATRSWSR